MSSTPLTDKAVIKTMGGDIVDADVARDLERKGAEWKRQLTAERAARMALERQIAEVRALNEKLLAS